MERRESRCSPQRRELATCTRPGESTVSTAPTTHQKATKRRCQSTNKAGRRCTAWALKGGTHCFFHEHPEKGEELGRQGGEAKGVKNARGARYGERSLKTVEDVTALLGDTIKDLGLGLIDPKEATAVGYLAAGMLKALQQGDIESRVRALEAVESRTKKSCFKSEQPQASATAPAI